MKDIYILDDLLSNFAEYKTQAKLAKYGEVISQGRKYKGISQDVTVKNIHEQIAQKTPLKPADVISFLRMYQFGYEPNTWIHSDTLFSDYIGILFVQSSRYPQDDGVALWYNKDIKSQKFETDSETGPINELVQSQGMDPEKWTLWHRIEFKENRMVIFPACWFHSKVTYGSHGDNSDNSRIVHVTFFNND